MQVSPVDIQAWASETGSQYPATPAEKAAVLPQVAAWKAEQLADAKAARGQNAISPLVVGAGAAGLSLAGLVAFNHFRKQGLSEPAAAAMAKQAQSNAPLQAHYRLVNPETQNTRTPRNGGPRLRANSDNGPHPQAATLETRGGRSLGATLARQQGQYKARSTAGFHDPLVAALDTPEKREIYLAGIADANGTDSDAFINAQNHIAALETTTPQGVDPTSFIAGLSPQQRFGTVTAQEQATTGQHLGQSRTKRTASAQAGFQSRDAAVQSQAKVFSPQARANQQADALANALSASGPGDMGATDVNNSTIEPEVLRQLQTLKRTPLTREDAPAHTFTQAPRAWVAHVPEPESTAAYQRLAHAYQSQGGSLTSLSAAAHATLLDHSEVTAERIANTTYADLQGNPLSFAEIHDKDNPIPKAVIRNGVLIAPNQYNPILDENENITYGAPVAPEHKAHINPATGNLKAPKPSLARRPTDLDPKKASVFFLDVDSSYKPYLGSKPVLGPGDVILSSGKRADNSPIAESDLAFFPTDNPEFYHRSGGAISHPFATDIDIAENRGAQPDLRFADVEDQGIEGMQESLPSSDSRFSTGVRKDGVSDNWVFARIDNTRDLVPLDTSGYQSEDSSPTRLAATRLKIAVGDHYRTTGQLPSPGVQQAWATDLARQHSVDPINVLNTAAGVTPVAPKRTPKGFQGKHVTTGNFAPGHSPALAAGTGDALNRVYNSLGMHAGADAWQLEGMVRSGDIKGAAAALASQFPALTSVNAAGLRGASQDEKLGIVAEGVSAGLKDLAITLEKYPDTASQFGIGKGAGGFGIDAYLKSYVRDWVTVRGLQLDPTGQPTYQVPNDAFEVIAHKAHQNGRSTLTELEDHVRGAATGLEAALKIDRLVSAAQSTKQGDPNTNATNFAQLVFDNTDPDLVSTSLTQEAAGDVKLSFGTRRNYDATAGFYDRNPNEAQLADAIDDYDTFTDGSQANYPQNSVLAAQVSGADYKTPEGRAQQQAAKDAQTWITANATRLERERADLNRGILRTDGTPKSFGRGFVLSADTRGAYLAGDTQGLNTSIRDEEFNDLDHTPLDRAQDNQREDATNNLLPEPDGIDVADSRSVVPLTEAELTARQYAATKLHFKNLGANSNGAMAPGEAFYPRQKLRRFLQERGQDESVGRILDSYLPDTSWSPRNHPSHPPTDLATTELDYSWTEPERSTATAEERQAAIDLDRRTLQHSTQAPYATVMPEGWKPSFNDPAIQVGVSSQPRADVPAVGSTLAAANYRAAVEARATGRGEVFLDDQNRRDAIAISSGYIEQGRRNNAAASTAALSGAQGGEQLASPQEFNGSQGGQTPTARPAADVLQLDANELGGHGRRGSTFAQKPIAAAPVSSIPAAAQDNLNTLRSSMERSVDAVAKAKAGHLADYMDKLAAGGLRTSSDGKRLIFNHQRQTGNYTEPGNAMVDARINGLRKRGII